MQSQSVAIVIAGALITAALLLGLMVDRYQSAGTFTTSDGTPGLYRMNTRNGAVVPCLLARDPKPRTHDPVDQIIVQCRD